MLKKAIVTGAAGFTGAVLVERLLKNEYEVYAIVRPDSPHNNRLSDSKLNIIECELKDINKLADDIKVGGGVFFHLAWTGEKTCDSQYDNVAYTLDALRVASVIGCNRFVCTGSQAEYGVVPSNEQQTENRMPKPITPYGAAKVAACYLSRQFASELGIEWIWGRIFSLIGKYEPGGRMLPDLYSAMSRGEMFSLSSCKQNWDYLDVYDAADALMALGERGVPGEIYNIANGDYRLLIEYTEELKKIVGTGEIIYGDDASPYISLQPSVEKIYRDTGWKKRIDFEASLKYY